MEYIKQKKKMQEGGEKRTLEQAQLHGLNCFICISFFSETIIDKTEDNTMTQRHRKREREREFDHLQSQ